MTTHGCFSLYLVFTVINATTAIMMTMVMITVITIAITARTTHDGAMCFNLVPGAVAFREAFGISPWEVKSFADSACRGPGRIPP